MTNFEESALRNSVADYSSSAMLPYWHSPDNFASLMHSHAGAEASHPLYTQEHNMLYMPMGDHRAAMDIQQSSLESNVPLGYRPLNDNHYNDFANLSDQLSRCASDAGSKTAEPMRTRRSLTVRTPTGTKSMRRPGLVGASALLHGRYCCQWSVHGAACGQNFGDPKQLNDHVKSHHVRGAGHFDCHWLGCDKGTFPTANKLVRHVHSHTGYKPFPCSECSQAFVTKDQLDKHLTTHTGAKDFVCTWPGCGRSFAVKHALDGHMNSVHLKTKKHTCPHCAQAFDDSSNLSKHKKQVHNKDTGIKCPARHTHGCTYVDSRKDKLKEHCEREGHGLETVSDPHAWSLWVQQFKTAPKRSDIRRQSRDTYASTPMSRAPSVSDSSFTATPYTSAPSVECTKQGCNLPVCLPCNIMCNNLHPSPLGEPCDDAHCDTYDPGCDDPNCDPSTIQPCNVPPCNLAQCRSICSSPTQPATPLGIHDDPYFSCHAQYEDDDLFQDHDHAFRLPSDRMPDYMSWG